MRNMKNCQQQAKRRHTHKAKGDMFFTVIQGSTETRANAVRPLDVTIRSYCLAITVFCFSLGGLPWLPFIMPFLFKPEEIVVAPYYFFWGVGFTTIGILSAVMYILDCVSRWALSRMSTSELRQRLARSEKSARYVAKASHLRGARIGAWFFGILAAASIVPLVTRWLAGGL